MPEQLCIGEYRLLDVLGKGARSKVLLAEKDNAKCALKCFFKDKTGLMLFKNEKKIFEIINGFKFLVTSKEFLQSNGHLFNVMEYIAGPNLRKYKLKVMDMLREDISFYISGILLAIEYLHNNKICHRDIHLGNVVLDSAGYPKLIDFEKSIMFTAKKKKVACCDFRGLAGCLFELNSNDSKAVIPKSVAKLKKESGDAINDLIAKLLGIETEDLSGFVELVKNHPFLFKTNWEQMLEGTAKAPMLKEIPETNTSTTESLQNAWLLISMAKTFPTVNLNDVNYVDIMTKTI